MSYESSVNMNLAVVVVSTNDVNEDICGGGYGFGAGGGAGMCVPMGPAYGPVPQFGIPRGGRYGSFPSLYRGGMPYPQLARSLPLFNPSANPGFNINSARFQNALLMRLLASAGAEGSFGPGGPNFGFGADIDVALALGYQLGREERAGRRRPPVTPPTTPPTTPGRLTTTEITAKANEVKAKLGRLDGNIPADPNAVLALLDGVTNGEDKIAVMKAALVGVNPALAAALGNDKNKIVEAFGKQLIANQPDADKKKIAGQSFLAILGGLQRSGGLSNVEVAKQLNTMNSGTEWADFRSVAANQAMITEMMKRTSDAANAEIPTNPPRTELNAADLATKKTEVADKLRDALAAGNTADNANALRDALSSLQNLPEAQKIEILKHALTSNGIAAATLEDGGVTSPEKVRKAFLQKLQDTIGLSYPNGGEILSGYVNAFSNGNQVMLQNDLNFLRTSPTVGTAEWTTQINRPIVQNALPPALRN